MDIRQLTYFLTILEENSITRAADRLHLAQPALSKQLKLLEEELGVPLIERTTRSIRATDAGKQLSYRAKQIIELAETTRGGLNDYEGGLRGRLRIGSLVSAGIILLPDIAADFNAKFPNVRFQVYVRNTPEIFEMLKTGLIDIGIIRTPMDPEIFESLLLPDEPMVAVTAREPFWKDGDQSVPIQALKNQPLMVHDRFRMDISDACVRAGFKPEILAEIDDTRLMLLWAETGMGVAIMQRDWLRLVDSDKLKHIVIDEPTLVTRTAVVWMKGRYMPAVAQHFLEYFK